MIDLENAIRYIVRLKDNSLMGCSSKPHRDSSEDEWNMDDSDVAVPLEQHIEFETLQCDSLTPWVVASFEREFITIYMPNNGDAIRHVKHYFGIFDLEVETVLQNFIPKFQDAYIGHRVASAVEYLLRSPEKNGIEDVKKAHRNLEQAVEHYENRGAGIL